MAAPSPQRCVERQRLTEAFYEATRDVQSIHNAEIEALVKGSHLERSDLALKQAQHRREEAKKALVRHIETHRCD